MPGALRGMKEAKRSPGSAVPTHPVDVVRERYREKWP
jgi:hypothetical protein